jgi:hypothetical protein
MQKINILVNLSNAYTDEKREEKIAVLAHFGELIDADDLSQNEVEILHYSLVQVITALLDIPHNDAWEEENGEWFWDKAYTENKQLLINF